VEEQTETEPAGTASTGSPDPGSDPVADPVRGDSPARAVTSTVDHTRTTLHLVEAGFATVFPVFYRFYDDNPVGYATIRNGGDTVIGNIDVLVNIPAFMDLPQRQQVPQSLEPGELATFDLQVLFNNALLGVTEGTRVAAQISVSFDEVDGSRSYSVDTTLDVANRNAMTWDDTRKAASFVTAKDPAILGYAKGVAGVVRDGGRRVINTNLRTAMAMLSGFRLSGLDYVIDPSTPYIELSQNAQAIDFLQFPAQTFAYGAGDCDDLTISYASTLEAIGIRTAFITIPGHIYAAFNTGIPEDQIRRSFTQPDQVIAYEGDAWVPVEVTLLDQGFMKAWATGAEQWRQHDDLGQAELVPVQSAWLEFEPVGFDLGERQAIAVPNEEELLEIYVAELQQFRGLHRGARTTWVFCMRSTRNSRTLAGGSSPPLSRMTTPRPCSTWDTWSICWRTTAQPWNTTSAQKPSGRKAIPSCSP
jgi:hypothetical protein